MMRTILTVAIAALSLALAGCAADGGLNPETTTLEYEGAQSGEHQEQLDCDDDAQVTGGGNVEDGALVVTVMDGSGEAVWTQEYTGNVEVGTEGLSGASGDWTIAAERSGDDVVGDEFKGEYTFNLTC